MHADRWTKGQMETDGSLDATEQIGASQDYGSTKAPKTRIVLPSSGRVGSISCLFEVENTFVRYCAL